MPELKRAVREGRALHVLSRFTFCRDDPNQSPRQVGYSGPMATPVFPTDTHARVADAIAHTFATDDAVDTILITNSCARGRATPESDLDLVLLATAGLSALAVAGLEARWAAFLAHDSDVQEFRNTGPFAHVHADVITGVYTPNVWDDARTFGTMAVGLTPSSSKSGTTSPTAPR